MSEDTQESKPFKQLLVANPSYLRVPYNEKGYHSFASFYPFYLGEHSNAACRRLHLVGTSAALIIQLRVLLSFLPAILARLKISKASERLAFLRLVSGKNQRAKLALIGLLQGYLLSWVGHALFAENKPATFKHPVYSLMGDLLMLKEIVLGQRRP